MIGGLTIIGPVGSVALKKGENSMNEHVKVDQAKADQMWAASEIEVLRDGKKIILPNDPEAMSYAAARKKLEQLEKAENQTFTVTETIDAHFWDGLVAFTLAVKDIYGFAQATHTTIQTFFGKMEEPPRLIHVKTGPYPEDFVQVPFGSMAFPNITGTLETGITMKAGIPVLQVTGTVKHKERRLVMEIVNRANEIVKEKSIYRAKSIIIERDEKTKGIELDEPLTFFDPTLGNEVPIFNKNIEDLIQTAVLTPLMYAEECRKQKIPLKRGVLFEGPYGCGKTLVSRQVARTANENGWTFMLVREASSLKYALTFARKYQPCVVFTEDIDNVVADRNEKANALLNDIDGVVGKNDEIIVVLTTNFADKIDKAFLRPGRLDAVVSIVPPEPEAVERLIRFYAGPLLDTKSDLSSAAKMMAGNIPAQIREVVERSKLSMIHDKRDHITGKDLEISAFSMQNHNDLLSKASEGVRKIDAFEAIVGKVVNSRLENVFNRAGISMKPE